MRINEVKAIKQCSVLIYYYLPNHLGKTPRSRCTNSYGYSYILKITVHSRYTNTPPTNTELVCISVYWVIIL